MTQNELIEKITQSAILQEHFRRGNFRIFCPCCVKRVVAFANQCAVEEVINDIVRYGNCLVELEENQELPTKELQKQHDDNEEKYRSALQRFYVILKMPIPGMRSFEIAHANDL